MIVKGLNKTSINSHNVFLHMQNKSQRQNKGQLNKNILFRSPSNTVISSLIKTVLNKILENGFQNIQCQYLFDGNSFFKFFELSPLALIWFIMLEVSCDFGTFRYFFLQKIRLRLSLDKTIVI